MKKRLSACINKNLSLKVSGRVFERSRLTSAEQKLLLSAVVLFLLGALVRFYRSQPMPMTAQETARSREADIK